MLYMHDRDNDRVKGIRSFLTESWPVLKVSRNTIACIAPEFLRRTVLSRGTGGADVIQR